MGELVRRASPRCCLTRQAACDFARQRVEVLSRDSLWTPSLDEELMQFAQITMRHFPLSGLSVSSQFASPRLPHSHHPHPHSSLPPIPAATLPRPHSPSSLTLTLHPSLSPLVLTRTLTSPSPPTLSHNPHHHISQSSPLTAHRSPLAPHPHPLTSPPTLTFHLHPSPSPSFSTPSPSPVSLPLPCLPRR